MKKIISLHCLVFLLFSTITVYAQTVQNKGRNIVLKENTFLVIRGDFVNQQEGEINLSGTIVLSGDWTNNDSEGDLLLGSTGLVKFNGTEDQNIGGASETWFPNLLLESSSKNGNKGGTVYLDRDLACVGETSISGKELNLNGHTFNSGSDINVSANGTITVDTASLLVMNNNKKFWVYDGGLANFRGTESEPAHLMCFSGYYNFEISQDGSIATDHAIFEDMGPAGLMISGNVGPPFGSLDNSTFKNGVSEGSLLTFSNTDPVTINNAQFTENTWGSNYNVTKLNDEGRITFNEATGNFAGEWYEDDPNNSIDWNNTTMEHEMSLEEGWIGMSSWVIPGGEDITIPFAPIVENLMIVLTLDGMYYPAQNINTIGAWESHDAFMIKMNEAVQFMVEGNPESNYTVQLNEGWSLMPVVAPVPVSSDELFSDISWTFQIAKEVAGTKVFWPAFGIYTLDEIRPGKSYLVRCNDPATVSWVYPPERKGFNGNDHASELMIHHPWNKVQQTNISHTIGFSEDLSNQFEEGDVIGVFTADGTCAGVTEVQAGEPFSITAFADDELTIEKEGFSAGEIMTFKKYSQASGEETGLTVFFDQAYPNADGQFVPNGISVVKEIVLQPAGFAGNSAHNKLVVYPNPNNGKFTIAGLNQATHIEVTDVKGMETLSIPLQGKQQIKVDFTGQLLGIYFIKTYFPERVEIKKVVIN